MGGRHTAAAVVCALLSRAAALDDVTATTAVDLTPFDGIPFSRADANQDGDIDIGDAIAALGVLFAQEETSCLAALDANGDAKIDIADPISILDYMFSGAAAPPSPFGPGACGPVRGDLACASHASCGDVHILYEAAIRNEGTEAILPPIRLVLTGTGSGGIAPANADGIQIPDGAPYWERAEEDAEPIPPGGSAEPIDLAFRGDGEPAPTFRVFARTGTCALYSLRLPAVTRLPEKIGIYRLRDGSLSPIATAVTGGEGSQVGPSSLLASNPEILAVAHGATIDVEVFRFLSHDDVAPVAPPVRPAGGPATALAVDPAGDVCVGGGEAVEVFRPDPDAETLVSIARIEFGSPIRALAAGGTGAVRILCAGIDGAIARARAVDDVWEALSPVTLPEGAAPDAFAWAGGETLHLLALDRTRGVFVLRVDPATAALAIVPGSPFAIGETASAIGVARDAFVYVAGEERIFAFRMLASGSLAIAGRWPIPEGVLCLGSDCDGSYLYGVSPVTRTILSWRIEEGGTLAEASSIRDSHPDYLPGPFAIR
ncbi:MAG: hypothetical protein JXP34_05935 [Planctomycetes bacterium]|nr:hypothetical protein [Planctomycetota bacterium]